MTVVHFIRNQHGITGFEVSGHSGYADYGNDIVCAAISSLTQTTVLGLRNVVQVDVTVEIKDGYLECRLPKKLSAELWRDSQLVMNILYVGLKGIEEEYQDFLRIEEV